MNKIATAPRFIVRGAVSFANELCGKANNIREKRTEFVSSLFIVAFRTIQNQPQVDFVL